MAVDPEGWNGEKIINSEEINFMTAERVTECIRELKTKNCEGYDRLPLRILKDGAPVCQPYFEKSTRQKKYQNNGRSPRLFHFKKKATNKNSRTTGQSLTFAQLLKYSRN